MRVTDISLYSNNVQAMTFSLREADQRAPYIVRNIVGLDAEEIVPKYYGTGLYTKPKYFNFGLRSREIVMRLVLNPRFNLDESYSDIRDDLYRIISSSRSGLVSLHFLAGGTTIAKIDGFITKFEAAHFTNLPEVQLTVTCNDPIFKAINPVYFNALDIDNTNPIIIPDTLSTAPHGFTFQLTINATLANFSIQDVQTNPEWIFKITPSGGFIAGDALYFSSEFSNKYLYMIRSGVTTYLLDKIDLASIWPILFPGGSSFWFNNVGSFSWNNMQYYPAYWGV